MRVRYLDLGPGRRQWARHHARCDGDVVCGEDAVRRGTGDRGLRPPAPGRHEGRSAAPGRCDARALPGSRCQRVAHAADERAANAFESVLRAIALDVTGLRVEPQVWVDDVGRPDLLDRSLGARRIRGGLLRVPRTAPGAGPDDCERYNAFVLAAWWSGSPGSTSCSSRTTCGLQLPRWYSHRDRHLPFRRAGFPPEATGCPVEFLFAWLTDGVCGQESGNLSGGTVMTDVSVRDQDTAHRLPVRTLVAASIGNAVEWYDWTVYATFSIYFATQIFSSAATSRWRSSAPSRPTRSPSSSGRSAACCSAASPTCAAASRR